MEVYWRKYTLSMSCSQWGWCLVGDGGAEFGGGGGGDCCSCAIRIAIRSFIVFVRYVLQYISLQYVLQRNILQYILVQYVLQYVLGIKTMV
jgi:hypothetical protein